MVEGVRNMPQLAVLVWRFSAAWPDVTKKTFFW